MNSVPIEVLNAAYSVIEQPPPPSLREILAAYRTKGDGDRELLLAMLGAKTSEDQRISSMAALQRSIIELHQQTTYAYNQSSSYPTQSSTYDSRDTRSSRRVHPSSPSRSPRPRHVPAPSRSEHKVDPHPRKRHRSSRSPQRQPMAPYDYPPPPHHSTEQFPPSPYSTSDRSESAEYSPRSRASMAINSLLSAGGSRRDANNDPSHQDRE